MARPALSPTGRLAQGQRGLALGGVVGAVGPQDSGDLQAHPEAARQIFVGVSSWLITP